MFIFKVILDFKKPISGKLKLWSHKITAREYTKGNI